MIHVSMRHRAGAVLALTAFAMAGLVLVSRPTAPPVQAQTPAPTAVPVGGKIQTDNACYVRLQDLPPTRYGAGSYGGHAAYNSKTGVLAYVGGADKLTDENTWVFSDLYGIKLDGVGSWSNIPYGNSVGYSQADDKGCRELASVQMSDTESVSVLGKDGCNNNLNGFGSSGGDIKELTVGATANSAGIRWVSGSGAPTLPGELGAGNKNGALVRLFAAWDSQRKRIIFGQGTFNDEQELESQDKIYSAKPSGSQFQVSQLRPDGAIPKRRFGTCAAYIYDQETGVDGVIVLGGQEGAPENIPATTYAEVWWLNFKGNTTNGEWQNISGRFTNLVKDPANPDAPYLGGRREGACAYDAETKTFYSWMGRASSSVPDGSSHSSGAWRVNLAQLGDATAALTWERLAKDNTKGVQGRRLIPSVWDPVNKRMFAVAGRNNLDAYQNVWAIYPGITGEACETLDPYAPFRPGAPTPTRTSVPVNTPDPNVTPATPTPTREATPVPPPAARAKMCPGLDNKVPRAVIDNALANPSTIQGWDQTCNPNLPPSPVNGLREQLGLQNPSVNFHPLFNSVVYKCGCP
jgi:hypothetical protein